ncbi:DUF58 domain-containing protein [Candidatus Woesearchaeota archaeon]|nr:DUF58 domain-containing protein [Candidatus Woesearchaeota archaeon]
MAKKTFKVSLIPSIKKLEIYTKGLTTSKLIGRYQSSFRGKGLEFETYRSYMPDDDASLIDWKATARSDDVLVKKFVEERNLNVYLLVDISSSMLYGSSTTKLKVVYAAELAASLCYAVLKAQDSVGFGLFSDHIQASATPMLAPHQFYKLCNSLMNAELYGGAYNLGNTLEEVFGFLPDKSVLIIISDFIGFSKGWEQKAKVAGKKFELVGIMVRDIYDRTLPPDEVNLLVESPFTDEQVLINPSELRRKYELHAKEEEEYIKSVFKKSNGDLLTLTTDKPFVKPLLTFFKYRERRWR